MKRDLHPSEAYAAGHGTIRPATVKLPASAVLSDRVRDFMFITTVALMEVARQAKTLEVKTRIDMELRRRQADSRRAERNGRGSCRWGTEDVAAYPETILWGR